MKMAEESEEEMIARNKADGHKAAFWPTLAPVSLKQTWPLRFPVSVHPAAKLLLPLFSVEIVHAHDWMIAGG
jgi:hypothetical protein